MNTKTSRSEIIVCGFAIAVLVAGFAAGVFAKLDHARPHTSLRITQISPFGHGRTNARWSNIPQHDGTLERTQPWLASNSRERLCGLGACQPKLKIELFVGEALYSLPAL